jgi:signal transduction histidine kinase
MFRYLVRSIQGRVFLALILLAIVPLLIVAAQGYHCARQAVVDLARTHLVSLVSMQQAMVSEWFEKRQADLHMAGSLPAVVDAVQALDQRSAAEGEEVLAPIRRALQDLDGSFEAVSVYSADWQVLTQSDWGDPSAQSPQIHVVTNTARGAYWDSPPRPEGAPTAFSIGEHIANADGVRVGYIQAWLNISEGLAPLLNQRGGLLSTGKSYLVTPDLEIVPEPSRGQAPAAAHALLAPAVFAVADQTVPRVHQYMDYRGVDVLGTAARLPLEDWLLVAEIDRAEALAWVDRLVLRAFVTVIVTLAAVVVVSVWMARLLGRPLRDIATVAHRIRRGETRERVKPSELAETEAVGRALNHMLDDLHVQQDRLVKAATLANIGQLTSSIVHEMRNPLSTIKMNLQAISAVIPEDNPRIELAQIASTQLGRLDRMLTDLLQFGRPLELHRHPAPFDDLARRSLEVTADELQSKQVTVDTEDATEGALLDVDREQMCRALSNLIVNAVQASPPGSTICLRAEPVPEENGYVEVSVTDAGPGLPANGHDKLFRPFFTTKTSGTGLGLANVKKIVELHGGQVRAENDPQGGARFSLLLPVADAGVIAAPAHQG